ncbi:2020_t:CDS:2 [Ambispora gerdemannii]|uniref:2020_t:CDS:1 n=1 Tax=Ambispora gerdemannii TaxID=144530 RepID=A0A9N9DCY7_9GLOM|nr:2020_t:CDS:2 [Ambispora gerdemannii]
MTSPPLKDNDNLVISSSANQQIAAVEAPMLQSKEIAPIATVTPRPPAVDTAIAISNTRSNYHIEQRVNTNLTQNDGIPPQEFQYVSTIPSKTELPSPLSPPPTKPAKPLTTQSNTLIDFDDLITSSVPNNVPILDKHIILPNVLSTNNLTASERTFLEYYKESSSDLEQPINTIQESKTNLEENVPNYNPPDNRIQKSPIFNNATKNNNPEVYQNYTILGKLNSDPTNIYLNLDIPFSSVITGTPNSGVDLMLQNILEGSLIQNSSLGELKNPLSALIFRFESTSNTQPSHRAFLGTSQQSIETIKEKCQMHKVIVLLSPSNYRKMSIHYKNIENCEVRPLFFSETELSINSVKAWLTIKGDAQIYDQCVELVDDILYDLGDYFDYNTFCNLLLRRTSSSLLLKEFFTSRLKRLDSFITEKLTQSIKQKGFWKMDLDKVTPLEALFQPGVTVIADLSDNVLNKEMVSILFDIILKIYIRSNNPEHANDGKLVVLDEAHKFFTSDSQLAETLQRIQSHLYQHNARLVIATHDPTLLPPPILHNSDLHILHHFSSPAWSKFLMEHIALENIYNLFQQAMQLKCGQQAFLFSPYVAAVQSDIDINPDQPSSVITGVITMRESVTLNKSVVTGHRTSQ